MLTTHLLLYAAVFAAVEEAYPRKDLLVEPAELARMTDKVRVLDCRPKEQFQKGHVPGAQWVDHNAWSKAFATNQEPSSWQKIIGSARLDPGKTVVIYDDAMSKDAARIWWILRYWGFKDARLLNEGWQGWIKAELSIVKGDAATATEPGINLAKPKTGLLATRESVLDIVKSKKAQIIDARSAGEYCGDTKLAKRGGAIPGAVHLEWSDLLDKKTKRFKRPDELRQLFKNAGIDLNKPAVAHCQSGGRSSVMAFTLELMGATEVGNYYRGWSEWGNDDETPVLTPKKK